MYLIKEITSDPKQKHTLILPNGNTTVLTIEYSDLQLGWFITQITYLGFTLNNVRLVTSPNILRQFKNQIPFGLGCFVQGNQEATLIQDFESGRAQLFILDSSEVQLFEEVLSGQVQA